MATTALPVSVVVDHGGGMLIPQVGPTIALHKAMHRRHAERLNARGLTCRAAPLTDQEAYDRAFSEPAERGPRVQIAEELKPDHIGPALYQSREYQLDRMGIKKEEWSAFEMRAMGDPSGRAAQVQVERADRFARMLRLGLNPVQLAVAMQCWEQRALDPATDTGQIGIDYLHDVYRVLRLSGQLQGAVQNFDIPAGYRQWTAPNINDAQFILQAAATADTISVNTAVDPTNGSQTWTPVKFQSIIFYNGEFNEDALYEVEPVLRASFIRGAGLLTDMVLLNGDTTNGAGANINANGGSLTLGTKDPRVAANGLRGVFFRGTHGGKSADTFTGGISGGGDATTLADFYAAKSGLSKYGSPMQKENLHCVMPLQSWNHLRSDARGSNFGQELIKDDVWEGCHWMQLANSSITHAATSNVQDYAQYVNEGCPINLTNAGVYDNTTKTLATWVLYNKLNYLMAWKRHLAIRVVELPSTDQYFISATVRFDFKEIIANEPSLTVAYNIL